VNKTEQKYILPSQRILNIINQAKAAGEPMGSVEISFLAQLAILDKLEEVNLVLRQFLPRPAVALEKPGAKKV
jgi:hypothetical protein